MKARVYPRGGPRYPAAQRPELFPAPVIAAVYVAVGWSAVLELDAFADALDAVELGLVVTGGLLYTAGAVVYALRRPNPRPGVFGYHEVFHALVVTAAAVHYAAALRLV